MPWKILVADGLAENGLAILRGSAQVDEFSEISAGDLLAVIAGYQVLVVRGRSRVTAELAVGMMFALARELPRSDATMKQAQWLKKALMGILAALDAKPLRWQVA
jgi:D-3-phosphoglycerate dehydrogenase